MSLQLKTSRLRLTRGLALGLAIWCAKGGAGAADLAQAAVKIENFSFVPETLTVHVGSTVTWENGDDIPHSVVLADKSFRSKPLDTHDKATFTFAKPGEVAYFCGLHPHMQGKIIVVP